MVMAEQLLKPLELKRMNSLHNTGVFFLRLLQNAAHDRLGKLRCLGCSCGPLCALSDLSYFLSQEYH
ncbi:hypothetical protein D3Y59_03885 [Hymenobacter oligotrophus]|uniref:Uncharacterized protein n=1 Tax=Hymenobacter oligotrophus TaxID=2319843 RepID=A0A3B7QTE0_9BACT|nr:hypothetical protein D3Y59_03885 [Hymenobacter oligotrophus]